MTSMPMLEAPENISGADHTYAALLRCEVEILTDLLNRLDAALGLAFANDIYTDETNG